MESFIKKVWDGKAEEAHNQFVRFGKGRFENRAVLVLQKTSKIKLRGSFEWVSDFAKLASELVEASFSGIILSKEKISELGAGKQKSGIIEYQVSVDSKKIQEIKDKVYALLLNAETPSLILKTKKKLPKPGKGADAKADDKFCQLEADLKYWPQIRDAFKLPECKKAKISHTILIEDIIIPEGEKDFVKIRELAKRKGKIIKISEVDSIEIKDEKEFLA